MSTRVAVSKMHGARNDFIVVDVRAQSLSDPAAFAQRHCDRRGGIGADGVLFVGTSSVADISLRVVNADGSDAEMCGNGVRCVARFMDERTPSDALQIETAAGIVESAIQERGEVYRVRVNMGIPHVDARRSQGNRATVFVGNPHLVFFVESPDDVDLVRMGELAQVDPGFPNGVNVHAVSLEETGAMLRMRHYERGVGLTMACGTGAVAAAAAAIARGGAASPLRVIVPGGELLVEWDGHGVAYMTGPAVHVFDTVV